MRAAQIARSIAVTKLGGGQVAARNGGDVRLDYLGQLVDVGVEPVDAAEHGFQQGGVLAERTPRLPALLPAR
jgi:hypothetical protein